MWVLHTEQVSSSPGTPAGCRPLQFNSDRSPGARRPHGVKTRCPRTAPTSTPSAGTGSPGRPHLCPTRLHTEGPRDALLRERRQHVADSPVYQKGTNSQRERWRARPGGAPSAGAPVSVELGGRHSANVRTRKISEPLHVESLRVCRQARPSEAARTWSRSSPAPSALRGAWGRGWTGPPSRHVVGSSGQPPRTSQGYASAQTRRGAARPEGRRMLLWPASLRKLLGFRELCARSQEVTVHSDAP